MAIKSRSAKNFRKKGGAKRITVKFIKGGARKHKRSSRGKARRKTMKRTRRSRGGMDNPETPPPPLRRNDAVLVANHPMVTRSQSEEQERKAREATRQR
jgi:hypothetical protein